MNRNEWAGTGKVFAFTLRQFCKSRATVISLIIMLLLAVAGPPAALVLGGAVLQTEPEPLQTVWLDNELPYELTASLPELPVFAGTTVRDGAPETLGADEAAVCIAPDPDAGWVVSLRVPDSRYDDEPSQEALIRWAEDGVQIARLRAAGFTDAQIDCVMQETTVSVGDLADYFAPEQSGAEARFIVQYVYAILVLILCVSSASYIVRAVVEEKASRLVELLMVSVRPMALIVGKILAMMAAVFGTLLLVGGAAVISWTVSSSLLDASSAMETLRAVLAPEALRLDGTALGAVIVSLILGYLGFSLLAGLCGCGCSAMEEINMAITPAMIAVLAGYLISIVVLSAGEGGWIVAAALLPVISVFCGPAAYICGYVGLGVLVASWAIQLVYIALLMRVSARMYQELLLHRGTPLRLRNIVALSRRKGGAPE